MTIREGDYLMWFAHFGSLEFQKADDLEDAVDTVLMLDDADTSTFDQYGCFEELEHVGHGIVADFDQLCDEARARRDAVRAKRAEEWKAQQAAKVVKDGPLYSISLAPPKGIGEGLGRYPSWIANSLTHDELIAERDRLEAVFGAERIAVRETGNA